MVEDIKSNLTVVVDEKSDIFHRTGVCHDYEQIKQKKKMREVGKESAVRGCNVCAGAN